MSTLGCQGNEEGRGGLVHRHLEPEAGLVSAVGIYLFWYPVATLGILLSSQLIGSPPLQMYPPHSNFKPCSGLLIPFQPYCAHMGENGEPGKRRSPSCFRLWGAQRAFPGLLCLSCPVAQSSPLLLSTENRRWPPLSWKGPNSQRFRQLFSSASIAAKAAADHL